ncbi:MAG: DUF1538 domain-containing protein [Synergistaceae bacterium]|jgi:hypothetical protein|nr:DUF1538 domain-containing protein [Synergistaceae bacterium]
MNKKLKEKIAESLSSVVPITLIVFVLSISLVPLPTGTTVMFLVGASMLVIGMGFFSLGTEMAMMPMGDAVGEQIGKSKKIWLIIAVTFFIGFIITAAEPDLRVLAGQVPAVPDMALISTVALGVGLFLIVAAMRTFFNINLSVLLVIFYIVTFIVAFFTPPNFTPLAFDSGGVTTGPITVPFIMAIGIGLSAARGGDDSQDDSFGLIALCSIGPVLAVLLLGIGYNPQDATHSPTVLPDVVTTMDVAVQFAKMMPLFLGDVLKALIPICAFFTVFQLMSKKFNSRQLARMAIGFIYTLIGLVTFLTGVNVGFIPVGHMLGAQIGASSYSWALIPLGMTIGYYIVVAEPAVHILNKQVEEISNGAISQRAMRLSLSIGVAVSLALAMARILTGISIFWLLIPGYTLAIAMSFFVPKIFVGIAFDSGGVASGPMTSTFLLPFAMGACQGVGGNVLTDAFGVVAMVAMTPLVSIQMMGLIYGRQMKAAAIMENADIPATDDIIEFGEDSSDE